MTLDDFERPKRTLAEKIVLRSPPGWKSRTLIARTISPTYSLFVAQGHPPTPRETWGNFGETRDGVEKKWRAGAQKRQYLLNT